MRFRSRDWHTLDSVRTGDKGRTVEETTIVRLATGDLLGFLA